MNTTTTDFAPGTIAVRSNHRYGGSRPTLERLTVLRTTSTQVIAKTSTGREVRFTKGKYDSDFTEVGSKQDRYNGNDAPLMPAGDPRIAQAEQRLQAWDAAQARSRALYAVQNTMAGWQRYGNTHASDDAIRAVIADLQALLPTDADA